MMYFAISHDTFPATSQMFDVISCTGNMRRHPNKVAISISMPMQCSFNHVIFIATYPKYHILCFGYCSIKAIRRNL